MRKYHNVEKLIKEKMLTSDKVALAVNGRDEDDNFIQQRLIDGVEGVNQSEYLYLKETATIKEGIAYSRFEGIVYSIKELKVLSQERSDCDIFWKTIYRALLEGVTL